MIGRKIIKVFGSWGMTAALVLSLCVSYMYFTFTESPFSGWMNFLYHSPSGLSLPIALIINLTFASLRIVFDRLKHLPTSPEDISAMDVSIEVPSPGADNLTNMAGWMKKHGFTGEIRDNSITARKGNFSFLPGTLMRAGLIMLSTALLFSGHLRKTEETILHEKEIHSFSGSGVSLENIRSNFPEEFLQIGEEKTFNLGAVSAVIIASGSSHTITSEFPVKVRGRYYRISDIGFSQQLLLDSSGEKIEKRLDLNILPPGKTDIIALTSNNLFLTFTLHPEKTIKKGLLAGKQFFLSKPVYHIVIQRGKEREKPETVIVRPGENITSGGVTVSLGKNSLFLKIISVYDPALFWIYTGFLLTLTGLMFMPSRFFWYQRQLSVVLAGDTFLTGYRQEFFKKWGIEKFHRWQEELVSGSGPAVDKSESSS